jgi:WD40 repeat protein
MVYTYEPGMEIFWRGVTFSPDDRYAVFAGDGALVLLDLKKQKPLWQKYIVGVPYDVWFSSDTSSIVVADKGDALWSYDFDGNLQWVKRDLTVLTDMDMSEDGSRIVTLSHDGTLRQFDNKGNLLWRRALGFGGHNGLDMTPDGGAIAVGSGGKDFPYSLFLFDDDGNLLWKHSEPGPVPDPYHPYMMSAMSVAISDDASQIVAGYGTGSPGVQWFTGSMEKKENGEEGQKKIVDVDMENNAEKGSQKNKIEAAGSAAPRLFEKLTAPIFTVILAVLSVVIISLLVWKWKKRRKQTSS